MQKCWLQRRVSARKREEARPAQREQGRASSVARRQPATSRLRACCREQNRAILTHRVKNILPRTLAECHAYCVNIPSAIRSCGQTFAAIVLSTWHRIGQCPSMKHVMLHRLSVLYRRERSRLGRCTIAGADRQMTTVVGAAGPRWSLAPPLSDPSCALALSHTSVRIRRAAQHVGLSPFEQQQS
jgi:hypothetical protein